MTGSIKKTDLAAIGIGLVGTALLTTAIVALALRYLAPAKVPALLLKTAFIATTLSTGTLLTTASFITPLASRIFKKNASQTQSQNQESIRIKSQYKEQNVPRYVQDVAQALLKSVPKNENDIWQINETIMNSQEGIESNLNTFFRDGAVIGFQVENQKKADTLKIDRVPTEADNNTEINTYRMFSEVRQTLEKFGVPENQLDLLALQVMILACQGNDASLLEHHSQSTLLQTCYNVSQNRLLVLQRTENGAINLCVRYLPEKRKDLDRDVYEDAGINSETYSEQPDTYPVFGTVYKLYSPEGL